MYLRAFHLRYKFRNYVKSVNVRHIPSTPRLTTTVNIFCICTHKRKNTDHTLSIRYLVQVFF